MVDNECVCVRALSRACPCRTRTHLHAPEDGRRSSRSPPSRPAPDTRPAGGSPRSASRGSQGRKAAARAWCGERQKAPTFARTEPWQNHTTMIPAVPPRCTPLLTKFPAAETESFPPPSPSAGDEQGRGPVLCWLALAH
jgi:hypothetical protein